MGKVGAGVLRGVVEVGVLGGDVGGRMEWWAQC